MQQLRPKCRSLLLLTATPMQVHPVELWDLLRLLGLPGRWETSRDDFIRYFAEAAGNPSQATMEYLADLFRETEAAFGEVTEEQVSRLMPGLGGLGCRKVLRALRDKSGIPLKRLDVPQRKAALEILRRFSPIRHRMARHTRNLLREYHRRGLIDTPIATRDVRDVAFDMTPAEKAMYDALGDYIDQTYNNAVPRETLGGRLRPDDLPAAARQLVLRPAADPDQTPGEHGRDHRRRPVAGRDGRRGHGRRGGRDARPGVPGGRGTDDHPGPAQGDRQDRHQHQGPDAEDRAGGRLRGRLRLRDRLHPVHRHDGLPEGLPGRGVPGRDRRLLLRGRGKGPRPGRLLDGVLARSRSSSGSRPGPIKFLVCTDAAAEGLNFQFCGLLVNYDLPWNPMKVEQRIGRIDRIGQRYPKIRVVNLAYQDTIEADVYFALGQRINLFEGLVGRLQPILSRLPKQFEEVALEKKENREAARHRLMADLDQTARDAGQATLDIDEVAADALEMPTLPPPALSPSRTSTRP